jgi:hypothetical protein
VTVVDLQQPAAKRDPRRKHVRTRPDVALGKQLVVDREHKPLRKRLLTRQSAAQLDGRGATAKLFFKIAAQIERDISGGDRNRLSRIELELVECFTGAAILCRAINFQIQQKGGDPVNIAAWASAANVLSKIGGQLGLARKPRDVAAAPSLSQYLSQKAGADEA